MHNTFTCLTNNGKLYMPKTHFLYCTLQSFNLRMHPPPKVRQIHAPSLRLSFDGLVH